MPGILAATVEDTLVASVKTTSFVPPPKKNKIKNHLHLRHILEYSA
jgi:hypothetical protein